MPQSYGIDSPGCLFLAVIYYDVSMQVLELILVGMGVLGECFSYGLSAGRAVDHLFLRLFLLLLHPCTSNPSTGVICCLQRVDQCCFVVLLLLWCCSWWLPLCLGCFLYCSSCCSVFCDIVVASHCRCRSGITIAIHKYHRCTPAVVDVVFITIWVRCNLCLPQIDQLVKSPQVTVGALRSLVSPCFNCSHRGLVVNGDQSDANLVSTPSALWLRISAVRIFSSLITFSLVSIPGRPRPLQNGNHCSL